MWITFSQLNIHPDRQFTASTATAIEKRARESVELTKRDVKFRFVCCPPPLFDWCNSSFPSIAAMLQSVYFSRFMLGRSNRGARNCIHFPWWRFMFASSLLYYQRHKSNQRHFERSITCSTVQCVGKNTTDYVGIEIIWQMQKSR